VSAEPPIDYRAAGVDIDRAEEALRRVQSLIRGTYTPGVVDLRSGFAAAYRLPGSDRILLASIDGVGTKLLVAVRARRFRGLGYDLVSHCVNDLLAHGGRPLIFLDYYGTGELEPAWFGEVLDGIAGACRELGCALVGGETAEMPGLYRRGEFDLVGAIVGEVDADKYVDGSGIRPRDVLIGIASDGLHTNGYSLARKILAERADDDLAARVPGTDVPWVDALLARHRSYLAALAPIVENRLVTGMAHVTGGGIPGNLVRILPDGVSARVMTSAWEAPPVFQALGALGRVSREELYRTFNMGVGYVLVVAPEHVDPVLASLGDAGERAFRIGEIVAGERRVELLDD
jgi:phosphoribosylformylglycinamidine cyclo-ligase